MRNPLSGVSHGKQKTDSGGATNTTNKSPYRKIKKLPPVIRSLFLKAVTTNKYMNRIIKFRAFHSQMQIMHDWDGLKGEDLDTLEGTDIWHVMQYTGLKDKNGKEIYEGDIIDASVETPLYNSTYRKTLQVIWQEQIAQFVMATSDTKIEGHIPKDCVVIGNIYENPELLHD